MSPNEKKIDHDKDYTLKDLIKLCGLIKEEKADRLNLPNAFLTLAREIEKLKTDMGHE